MVSWRFWLDFWLNVQQVNLFLFLFFDSLNSLSLSDVSGDIGPFQLAIALTIIALLCILPWNENYGHDEDNDDQTNINETNQESQTFLQSLKHSLRIIKEHPDILLLGLSQAFFEGAVYSFGKILFL